VHDVDVLIAALVVTYLPGLSLMAALGVRRPVLLAALAPAASVAVAGVTGVLSALFGLRFGPTTLGFATGLLVAVAVVIALLSRRRARQAGSAVPGVPRRRRSVTAVTTQVVGAALVLVGAGVGVATWLTGLGVLSTPPQEHDMIIHAMQAAYIEQSGRAAPWELVPADVVTGSPVAFYPAGFHLLVAITSSVTGAGTVTALNAMTVAVLAVVLSVSAAALTVVAARQLGLSPASASLAGGIAALVAAGLYRPTFHLMHDGGILANAAALAITPGVVAGLLLLPRLRAGAAIAVGAACAGVLWVHPSAVVSVGLTVLAWWAGQALARQGRRQLRGLTVRLLVALASAWVFGVAALSPVFDAAGRTAGFPPDTSPASLRNAVGNTLGMSYSGFIDPKQAIGQATAAALTIVGVVAVLMLGRGYGPVTAWATWCLVTIAQFMSPGKGWEAPITGVFYNALLRTWSHVSLLVPVLAALGVVLTANLVAVLVRRRVPLPARPVAAILALLAFAAYFNWQAPEYTATNERSVATRYSDPDFVRVGPDDERAFDWLAQHIQPGQRVLNSPNDGSTYLYVEHGIPVVNVYTLGLPGVPYSYQLLESFDTYPTDGSVRSKLLDLDVAWVYVDATAPLIGSKGSPDGWAGTKGFALAPGFARLEGLPGLVPRFRSGTVTVYSLDLDVLRSLP
jgi:hypothetical protein